MFQAHDLVIRDPMAVETHFFPQAPTGNEERAGEPVHCRLYLDRRVSRGAHDSVSELVSERQALPLDVDSPGYDDGLGHDVAAPQDHGTRGR